jgi:hypothetical protein
MGYLSDGKLIRIFLKKKEVSEKNASIVDLGERERSMLLLLFKIVIFFSNWH